MLNAEERRADASSARTLSASTASFDATTRCPVPPPSLPERAPRPKINPNAAGMSTVLTRKALLRIRSKYSRRAINNASRIHSLPHRLDENLFQRRLNQFEAINACLLFGRTQQCLRVGVLLQPDLHMTRIFLAFGNCLMAQKPVSALEIDNHPVAFVARFYVAHLA